MPAFRECLAAFHPVLRNQLQRRGCTAENLCRRRLRGGSNPWDVSWIIAQVLDAALSFEEEASVLSKKAD